MIADTRRFRRDLLAWYGRCCRDLPWRRTRDPWSILVSEIMLQQTRVAAAIPFYERFLARFPHPRALAEAPEQAALAAWSGLGYYSRVRNLRRAAGVLAEDFPKSFAELRALPGVGPYTAAAVGSIAFGWPRAAVDGNVLRVLARIAGETRDIAAPRTRARLAAVDEELLDWKRPGDFNQAMMELGATVCIPRDPACPLCPVSRHCIARAEGRQNELPVKLRKGAPRIAELEIAVVRRRGMLLLAQRGSDSSRMAGFWELPETAQLANFSPDRVIGAFRHAIVDTIYAVKVVAGSVARKPGRMRWFGDEEMAALPLTTISRKALRGSSVSLSPQPNV